MVLDVKSFVKNKKLEYSDIYRTLMIIQVGNDGASNAYIKGKVSDCKDVGWAADVKNFQDGVHAEEIERFILEKCGDYDGIILQKPAKIVGDENVIINAIRPSQDVDGFKVNSPHTPCTPLGIMMILKEFEDKTGIYAPYDGKDICVIGRGKLVGKPMVKLLSEKTNANIIWLNSHSGYSLDRHCRQASVIITAAGSRNLIDNSCVSDETLVIDAGISFDENGKICGDCNKELYDREEVWVTKTPGGVGLTTRLAILENLKNAANYE